MNNRKINNIVSHFLHSTTGVEYTVLSIGNINESYIVNDTKNSQKYILQLINSQIFPNLDLLMENAQIIFEQIVKSTKLNTGKALIPIKFISTTEGNSYYKSLDNMNWRMMEYIPHQIINESELNVDIASEAAMILGRFHTMTKDINPEKMNVIIPNFHHTDYYFNKLILKKDLISDRRETTKDIYNRILEYKYLIDQYLHVKPKLPKRVVHNDPKLSNILFDDNHQAISIIDWDTIMSGYLCADFGDAIRSFCNTAEESESDLSKVKFRYNIYKAYTNSYIDAVEDIITPIEKDSLPLFAMLITYEQTIRFYDDYLDEDTYYKVDSPIHNLVRTKVQLKLLDDMNEVIGKNIHYKN